MDDEHFNPHMDQRRSPRIYRRFILRAAAFGDQPLRWSFLTIFNLSFNGILFSYEKPVYEGMLLHFRIDFPDRVVECMGRVVRVIGQLEGLHHEVAAKFEVISQKDRDYIEEFIQQNLP